MNTFISSSESVLEGECFFSVGLPLLCLTRPIRVVAALLVILRMSVKEAIQAFARICNAVFAKDDYTPEERTSKLDDIIKQLLQESKIPIDRKLLISASEKPDPVSGCKMYEHSNCISIGWN